MKELVASLRPRPAMPDLFRRLPGRRPDTGNDSGCFSVERHESNHEVAPAVVAAAPGVASAPEPAEQAMLPLLAMAGATRATQRLEPIAAELQRAYFDQNRDAFWSDALVDHGLLST